MPIARKWSELNFQKLGQTIIPEKSPWNFRLCDLAVQHFLISVLALVCYNFFQKLKRACLKLPNAIYLFCCTFLFQNGLQWEGHWKAIEESSRSIWCSSSWVLYLSSVCQQKAARHEKLRVKTNVRKRHKKPCTMGHFGSKSAFFFIENVPFFAIFWDLLISGRPITLFSYRPIPIITDKLVFFIGRYRCQ